MIGTIHSCGDCGVAGDHEVYKAHLKRRWHRLVIKVGLKEAVRIVCEDPGPLDIDAARAIHIAGGGKP
jgi:hypothetical protein